MSNFILQSTEEIFAHILNKALNNRMVDPSMIFIDGTHLIRMEKEISYVTFRRLVKSMV